MKLSRTSADDGVLMYAGVIEKVGYEIQSDEKMKGSDVIKGCERAYFEIET